MEPLLDAARRYYEAGLNVLPASKKDKRPIGAWKQYTEKRPAFEDVFKPGLQFDAVCVVCGQTSGGLEIIDFDQKGAALKDFLNELNAEFGGAANIFSFFVSETTQSGGVHLGFKSPDCGRNQKLALDDKGGVLIETRGAGGICLIAPSNGYEITHGDWTDPPELTARQRECVLDCARKLNKQEVAPKTLRPMEQAVAHADAQQSSAALAGESVADYLRRDLTPLRDSLTRAGWQFIKKDTAFEYWRRPGQTVLDRPGGSIDEERRFFYCFTSNAAPLEPSKAYSPLDVISLLDFGGDISRASKDWRARIGGPTRPRCVNLTAPPASEVTAIAPAEITPPQAVKSKRPVVEFPRQLYDAPGLLSDIQEEINKRARRPQPAGGFLAAFCAVSYLVGRSIELYCDGATTTPNIYGLFLAPSGMGKEAPRRVCADVSQIYNGKDAAPEAFASVQALQNMLSRVKKVFWLHDEFGRDLAYMSNDRNNSNIAGIITESLKLYSNANNRAYLPKLRASEAAGVKRPEPIDRPYLTIYATGNPRDFYASAGETLLHNGYIARFTIVEGEDYAAKPLRSYEERVTPRNIGFAADVQARVAAWRAFEQIHENNPEIIDFTPDADATLLDYDATIEAQLQNDSATDEGASEIMARYSEKLWKYALLFGASKFGARRFTIDKECAELAVALIDYEARLFKASAARYDSGALMRLTFDVLDWARAVGGSFTKSAFTRKFQRRGTRREREEVLDNLLDGAYLGLTSEGRYVVISEEL